MRYNILILTMFLAACDSSGKATPTAPVIPTQTPVVTKTGTVRNFLGLSVEITSSGVSLGTLASGATSTLTLPATATSITYVPKPATYAGTSTPIPNDMPGATIPLGTGASFAVDINNVVNGQPYIFPVFTNNSGMPVSFAVSQGGVIRCLATASSVGPYEFGYYALTSTTQFRVYQTNTACAGAYIVWSDLTAESNTGSLYLVLSYPPIPARSVTLAPSSGAVELGATLQLAATIKDSIGGVLSKHQAVWSSSNPAVVSVSSTGLLRGLALGVATITATSWGVSATGSFSVGSIAVSTVRLCDQAYAASCLNSTFLLPGQAVVVRAVATGATGVDLTSSCVFQWAATVPNIVTIVPSTDAARSQAVITRISTGSVGVTATCNGKVGVFTM